MLKLSRAGVSGFSAILVASLLGCSSETRPDPRDTVKGLFNAIRASDSLYLSENIDLDQALTTLGEELSSAPGTAGDLLAALTGEGRLRKRWLENQIVLGDAAIQGDTAWVEVSFIDRLTRVQYYNKMRLDYRNGRWIINSFRTL